MSLNEWCAKQFLSGDDKINFENWLKQNNFKLDEFRNDSQWGNCGQSF